MKNAVLAALAFAAASLAADASVPRRRTPQESACFVSVAAPVTRSPRRETV
jgi:hypothetical protein